MKRYSVKLVRRLDQSAVVAVDAENASDAAHAGIKMVPLFWRTDITEDTYYESVKEIETPKPEPEEKCKETVIHGYKVELELFEEDGEPRSDCSVTRTIRGVEFGGSMGMLMGFGHLEDYNTGDEYDVPERHRNAIIKWAEANGY